MNPNDPKQFERFTKAFEWSWDKLKPFRQVRLDMMRQVASSHYGTGCSEDKVPLNELRKFVRTYTRRLASRDPRILVRTQHAALKPKALKFEMALNFLYKEIGLVSVLRRCLVESMFSMGIARTGLKASGQIDYEGYLCDAGQPYASAVSLDDWVHDMGAPSLERARYYGNCYRVPLEWAKSNQNFDAEMREKLAATEKISYGAGETSGETLTQGQGGGPSRDEIEDYVKLWDFWFPQENLLVTASMDGAMGPLQVEEWEGPETGPYRHLFYEELPSNSMPLAPLTDLKDQHDLINILYRKIGRQAERQKTLGFYKPQNQPDAEKVKDHSDGDLIGTLDPEGTMERSFGGPHQANFAFIMWALNDFSSRAGNLDAMAGLGPQADTFGQEQIINQSVSQMLDSMGQDFLIFAGQVGNDLGWYLWHDPLIELPLTYEIPSIGIRKEMKFSPEDREADFYQYNLELEPYSMSQQSPKQRLQSVQGLLQQVVLPGLQSMTQQGVQLDWEGLIKLFARYTDIKELGELIQFVDTPPSEGPVETAQRPEYQSTKSPASNRTYTRVNRPGATQQGKSLALISKLLGAQQQPFEAAQANRPIG